MTATETTGPGNLVRQFNFSGPHIQALAVSDARNYYVSGETVVVNVSRSKVSVDSPPRLPP